MTGRWFVTPHAVRRFVERYMPRATFEDALAVLVGELDGARYIRDAHGGCRLYRLRRPRDTRIIVDPGKGCAEAVITVLR